MASSPDAAAPAATAETTASPTTMAARRARVASVTLRGVFLASIAVLILAMCLAPADGRRDPQDDKIPNKE